MDGGEAGPIAQAAGNITAGIGGFAAGQANAKLDKRNAQQALIDATGQEQQVDTQARAAMGEQIAAQGAGGFQVGTGSNLDALTTSATNREMDLMNIRRQAQGKANAYDYQAGLDKLKGQGALMGGLFGAAGAMTKGFSDAAYQKQLASGSSGSTPMSWGGSGWDSSPDDTSNYGGF